MEDYNPNDPKDVFSIFKERCRLLNPSLKDYSMCFDNINDMSVLSMNIMLTPYVLEGEIKFDGDDQVNLADIVNCCSCDENRVDKEVKEKECKKSCELYKQLVKKLKIN